MISRRNIIVLVALFDACAYDVHACLHASITYSCHRANATVCLTTDACYSRHLNLSLLVYLWADHRGLSRATRTYLRWALRGLQRVDTRVRTRLKLTDWTPVSTEPSLWCMKPPPACRIAKEGNVVPHQPATGNIIITGNITVAKVHQPV